MRALAFCRDLPVVRADALAAFPCADEVFDAVILLDVLEHLVDPHCLLDETHRVLIPGGVVVIMVPAGPELWSYWDGMHGHQRRYTRASLAATFGPGWRRLALEYSFSWMYPVVWSFRRLMENRRRSSAHSDFIEVPRVVNSMQVLLGKIEGWAQRLVPAPIGTTLSGVWSKEART
jgi:SAM-dependent methyltransferase